VSSVDGSPWRTSGLEVLREGDFAATRLNRPGVYVVCFGAAWCPITRRFVPKFLQARGRIRGTEAIADITELDSPLWDTFRIRITPSLLVFRDGDIVLRVDGKRFVGVSSRALARLEESLSGLTDPR